MWGSGYPHHSSIWNAGTLTMTWNYAYTPYIWPSVFTIFLLIGLAGYAWRRRSVPGTLPFTFAVFLAVLWATGSALEYAALDPDTKIAWVKFQTALHLPAGTAVTCFLLEYVWPGRWLTRRNLVLLAIVPLLVMGLILSDYIHHLVWRGFIFERSFDPPGAIIQLNGPAGWLIIAYSFGLVIVNLIVLAWLFQRSPKHRWPVVLIVFAQISGRLIYTLDRAQVIQSDLPLDVLIIGYMTLFYAIALFGLGLFDPVALARQTVIDQLSHGVIVLDDQGRVASLNPTAEKVFGLPASQVKDRPVWEILPSYPPEYQEVWSGTVIEFCLARDGAARDYRMSISQLSDWRGLDVGHLLLLQDVTEQKRAQAQLLEQQRALAMLREREQLAREMHDGIGQVLGYVKMQAQAARDQLAQDCKETVDSQLRQLAAVAQDAHADVREYILGAKAETASHPGFLSALRQYLQRFSEHYPLHTELIAPPDWSDEFLEATAAVHLLRIIQEALTNARKYAQAQCVQVRLQVEDGRALVVIQDDGTGFDPTLLQEGQTDHYGLQFMRERAEQIGGYLTIDSLPGAGTRVMIDVSKGISQRRKERKDIL
jgi:PAS domain S-box-containing protein